MTLPSSVLAAAWRARATVRGARVVTVSEPVLIGATSKSSTLVVAVSTPDVPPTRRTDPDGSGLAVWNARGREGARSVIHASLTNGAKIGAIGGGSVVGLTPGGGSIGGGLSVVFG